MPTKEKRARLIDEFRYCYRNVRTVLMEQYSYLKRKVIEERSKLLLFLVHGVGRLANLTGLHQRDCFLGVGLE